MSPGLSAATAKTYAGVVACLLKWLLFGFTHEESSMEKTVPADAGMDASRLDRIKPLMQGYVDEGKIAGINTLVARRGKIAHIESFGRADIEAQRETNANTIFRIYSMSKPVTVVAALMLYERGQFGLNDSIADYIPSFKEMTVATDDGVVPANGPITIRHLMTHTAGISYDATGTPAEAAYTEARASYEVEDLTSEQVIDKIADLPLLFHPGEHWHYGLSIDVIGRLVEVVSGKRFGEYLKEELFAPLGMADTGFMVAPEDVGRVASLYAPHDKERRDLENNLELIDEPEQSRGISPRRFESGGGGLVSTITDYARFAQMLVNGGSLSDVRILGRRTVALMASENIAGQAKLDYNWTDHCGYTFGLGVRVMENPAEGGSNGSIGEYGWSGQAGTWVWIDPTEEMIALYMPQLIPDMYYPAAKQFSTIVYSALQ